MSKVRICVEIDEADLAIYEREAKRRGVAVEALVEQMVRGLIRELKEEEEDGTDHLITP